MDLDKEDWQFYLIKNGPYTYAGVSPDPVKRLRKHNGEISGGAKYTASKGSGWEHICLVKGFPTKIESLQFEWAVKHESPRNVGGINARIHKMRKVLCKEKWTSKSPLAETIPLEIEWKCKVSNQDVMELPVYICEKKII
jgi:predicted GIY-YIG superfamily endonuclease